MLSILFSLAFAAPFEGTITYEMSYSGTGADQMAAFAPTGTVVSVRGGSVRLEMQGGMSAMVGPVVVDSSGSAFMLQPADKVAVEVGMGGNESTSVVTKESGSLELLGYRCDKYTVVESTPNGKATKVVWAAPELELASHPALSGLAAKNVDGLTLKSETTVQVAGMEIVTVMVAAQIDPSPPALSLFQVPSDYTVQGFDPSTIAGPVESTASPDPVVDDPEEELELGLGTGGNACGPTLGASGLGSFKELIMGKPEAARQAFAKRLIQKNCLSSAQLAEVLPALGSDDNRMAFAEFAYAWVKDPLEYRKLRSGFASEASGAALVTWVDGQQAE